MASWLRGSGIEIGALHNPLSVPAEATVRYVDRLPQDKLREHYPELAGAALAPVTIIGDAEDLSALPDRSVDFVIANHLLEHLEDPISGLREMHRVIRPSGILYLALPDPRVTFDRLRPLTTVEHLLAEFRRGVQGTRRTHYEEWVDLVESQLQDWDHALSGEVLSRDERVRKLMDMRYSIHFHVWQPETFKKFLRTACDVCRIQYEIVAFEPCTFGEDDEFIYVLRRLHRRRMMRVVRRVRTHPMTAKTITFARRARHPLKHNGG
jgi:SAM-dependent methyltransferase